jgi:hypothetical protein
MPFSKKKKKPTYLPTVKNMSRVTANIQFFKDGPITVLTLALAVTSFWISEPHAGIGELE